MRTEEGLEKGFLSLRTTEAFERPSVGRVHAPKPAAADADARSEGAPPPPPSLSRLRLAPPPSVSASTFVLGANGDLGSALCGRAAEVCVPMSCHLLAVAPLAGLQPRRVSISRRAFSLRAVAGRVFEKDASLSARRAASR